MATHDQFEQLLKEYEKSKHSFDTSKTLIEYITANKLSQHSELILDIGVEIAQNNPSKLEDPSCLALVDEFFLAALELKQNDWAQVFLRIICIQFPDSVKTMRYLGMLHESLNDTMRAQEIYLEIIEKTPEDGFTVKRLVSFYRNNDMVTEAITLLNKYLETNQVDEEAW